LFNGREIQRGLRIDPAFAQAKSPFTYMKTIFAVLACFTILLLPATAAGPNDKRLSMEQRLREADIAVALKHYERVCTELCEYRFRQELAAIDEGGKPAERELQLKILLQKIEVLERYAKNLREELLKAGRVTVGTD